MAQEGCNLDKEEAEIFKPPSPPHPLTPAASTPIPLFQNHPREIPTEKLAAPAVKPTEESQRHVRLCNRCWSCRKRVGLTGFRCRCGELFCGRHRYSDIHDCSFDYKAIGREEICKANPVVRASKILKM